MQFGSVRFFKHLILCFLFLLIAVPMIASVVLAVQNHSYLLQLGRSAPAEPVSGMHADATDAREMPLALSPVAETSAYQQLYPDLYAERAEVGTVDAEKTVYLTFEGGPSAKTTKILAVLAQCGVKATFFATAGVDQNAQQLLRDVAAAGHTLGVYTYSHDYKRVYASVEAYLEDFYQMYQYIYTATGTYPQVFRFMGGSINGYNGGVYKEIIAEMTRRGFVYFDWNVTTVEQALSPAEDLRRAVVLLRDGADERDSLVALPAIIEGYQSAGFTFAPLTPEVRQVTLGA